MGKSSLADDVASVVSIIAARTIGDIPPTQGCFVKLQYVLQSDGLACAREHRHRWLLRAVVEGKRKEALLFDTEVHGKVEGDYEIV